MSEDEELPEELQEDEPDWEMAPDSDAEFEPDAERREFLRGIAEDVYGDSSESKQLSAILYRVSDLYDPDEDTSPEEIYLNVRHIMDIKAKGGLRKD
ncbi:hypothetical protein C499_03788 [Halogeometricum borinquense DSM 11551]|uniref:Uncharacterized protein n=2 Tax=Halogeometricum borinquense TaxID=60847 RepID=E4NRR2_HALBP|nr:hypothetical protein [Halogeometricum borinquense]ADQ66849.1 hypothetical protein Hbor_12620 [Halogeometricum borinquense DSM 11551]ELY30357.1 hypothetical protein C499_03788 [Halogeometricum borinquense DSM 11551]RYJ14115.1 hypothetical protein ELS19_09165 [Halogeometricum borinquense]